MKYIDVVLDQETNMEVDTPKNLDVTGFKEHFNGAVPIKRARMDLTTTTSEAALLRKRKEAERIRGLTASSEEY